jgi:hypothetical protein
VAPPWPRLTAAPDRFFTRLLGVDVGLGWEPTHCPGWHAKGFQERPPRGRLAGPPGAGGHPCRRFCHRRRRSRPKLGVDRRAMLVAGTAWLPQLEVLQLFEPSRGIRLERAMEAGVGHATQAWAVTRGDPLTAPGESFQAHLEARIGRLKMPLPPRYHVRFAQRDRDPGRAPHGSVAINLALATRPYGAQKVSVNHAWSIAPHPVHVRLDVFTLPCTVTITQSTSCRIIAWRSASVVPWAHQSAGISLARLRIASRSTLNKVVGWTTRTRAGISSLAPTPWLGGDHYGMQ